MPDCDQPFHYVYNLCHSKGTHADSFIRNSLASNREIKPLTKIADKIRLKSVNATKFLTYANDLNPSLSQHPVYATNSYIPDYQREAFSRLRLMSHSLKIETGRWHRIPRHLRVCPCDEVTVQSEKHVLLECPMTNTNRSQYPMLNFTDLCALLGEVNYMKELCEYVFGVLRKYS